MLMEQLEQILPQLYSYYLEERRLEQITIKTYIYSIRKFMWFLDNIYINPPKKIELINDSHYYDFANYIKKKNVNISTQDTYLSVLKSFFEYMYYKQGMKILVLHSIEFESNNSFANLRRKMFYIPDELKTILDYAKQLKNTKNDYLSHRNYLLILLMCYCGMTLEELSNLEDNDISFENEQIFIKNENKKYKYKENARNRYIYINPLLIKIINDYLVDKNNFCTTNYMFPSEDNKCMSARTIQRVVKDVIIASGIDVKRRSTSPKILRISFIKMMINDGVELQVISSITGLDVRSLVYYLNDIEDAEVKAMIYLDNHPLL